MSTTSRASVATWTEPSPSHWEGPAGGKMDFAGAEDGIDEEASFRKPLKALRDKRNTVLGRYACILSGAGPSKEPPLTGSH